MIITPLAVKDYSYALPDVNDFKNITASYRSGSSWQAQYAGLKPVLHIDGLAIPVKCCQVVFLKKIYQAMAPIEKKIPDMLTLGNLLCGCLAVAACLGGDPVAAGWLIFAAALFDLLDGMAAKLLNASSAVGAQLDSLADVVSFGLVPGLITYMLIEKSHAPWLDWGYVSDVPVHAVLPFILTLAAAYRLAKFNAIGGQSQSFKGMPVPAAAMFFASLPLMMQYEVFVVKFNIYYISNIVLNGAFLLVSVLLISWLMLSGIPLFSLKISSFRGKGKNMIILFLVISAALFAFLLWAAVPIILLLYIIFSYISKSTLHEIQSAD